MIQLDFDHFASCSDDKTIKIWKFKDLSNVRILTGHIDKVYGLKIFDVKRLLSGSHDYTVKLWDWKTG